MRGPPKKNRSEAAARERSLVYGPVPSRRLGRSLGVDVVPFKVCDFDCIYCQLGRTTIQTVERKAYVSPEEVLPRIAEKLRAGARPDFITMGGSGEPTLNSALGDIIAGVKKITDVPVAVLTNGALLSDAQVRSACAKADVVLPDLDAGDEETFRVINRPGEGLTLKQIVQGLAEFRKEFSGQIWLEVFLVAGVNDSEAQVKKIARLAERVRPDKIQLNTAVRPPAFDTVSRVTAKRLEELSAFFTPRAEVVADFSKAVEKESVAGAECHRAAEDEVLGMLRRRPCTVTDIAAGLGISEELAAAAIERLAQQGRAQSVMRGSDRYFSAGTGTGHQE